MIKGTNFIGKTASAKGKHPLFAINPTDNSQLAGQFTAATEEEINAAVEQAQSAYIVYQATSSALKADFLDAIAEEIMALGDELVQRASSETGLPEGRIQGERGRTCNQLKLNAALLREGSWVNATIDTAIPDRSPVPKPDLRKMQIPIGPVVVFGASNFPLAYSTAGGDTASALAAGNPVIVKGHESHLGTNDLVSQAILSAAEKTGMPDGVFSMVNGGIPVGQQLVKHPLVKAVGFTGSFKGGKALFDLANQRPEPIPVYAEMGSINPTFILPNKLEKDPEGLAGIVAGSITLGVGQFCTNPGLLIAIRSEALTKFSSTLESAIAATPPSTMLNEKIATSYYKLREEALSQTGVSAHGNTTKLEENKGNALTASVDAQSFLANPKLHEEVFGPFSLMVVCQDASEMEQVASALQGQLTGSLLATEEDLKNHPKVISALRQKVGRIIFDGMPTGVEVCPSMHHGGPFPSSSDGKFTSVGKDAIYRFVRPVSYQNWPNQLLPKALQDGNPLGIWRTVNNTFTKD
ncbi:MAG: alpha-ketoglutaric semialdehyde dehydrogenase [Roseivirga sp.]|jgi:alpha-ketoglutaric semialdehyde dehydrogenase